MAQLAKYKLEPYCYELFCDCGEKMRADFDLGTLFTSLLGANIGANKDGAQYKYVCPKCGKSVISNTNYELGEVKYKYESILEVTELEMTNGTTDKEA